MKLSVTLEFTSILKFDHSWVISLGQGWKRNIFVATMRGVKFIQKPRKNLSEIVTYVFINPESPNFILNEYLTLYLPFIQHKCTTPSPPRTLPSTVNATTPVM